MSLLIDSHVHIYPHYDTGVLLNAFQKRISAVGASAGVMMLAEREGTDAFVSWATGDSLPAGYSVVNSDDASLILCKPNQPDIIIVAGRQIACAERVEILALATRATFHDGTPAKVAIAEAITAGAVPVLAWGVGKWLFKRAKVVASLLKSFEGEQLLIGDPSLRPVFWPTPRLMATAATKGHRVIAGSDPLPPKNEETRVGQYADLAPNAFLDLSSSLTPQISSILTTHTLSHTGRRAGLVEFFCRMTGR